MHMPTAEALACQNGTFGLPFAYSPNSTADNRQAILRLQGDLAALRRSPEHTVGHLVARASINASFLANDQAAFREELGYEMETPSNIVGWIEGAPVEHVEKYANWNIERTESLHSSLMRSQDRLNAHTLHATQLLIDAEVFPKRSLTAVEVALYRSYPTIKAIDTFQQGLNDNLHGFCSTDTLGIANLYSDRAKRSVITPLLKEVYFHEVLHGAGMTRNQGFMDAHQQESTKRSRFLEEGFIGHLGVTALQSDFDPYDFSLTEHGSTAYTYERQLLAKMTESSHSIDAASIGHAFFTDHGSPERNRLERRLNSFFARYADEAEGPRNFAMFNSAYEMTDCGDRPALLEKVTSAYDARVEELSLTQGQIDLLGFFGCYGFDRELSVAYNA